MEQPYVIAKAADHNEYLSSTPGSWAWVPAGSWRNKVLSFRDLVEAEKFSVEFTRQTGIPVEVVMKWEESIDEILDILGVQEGPWEGRARVAIGMLWQATPAYPRR
jgi:hypothetical protein